MEVGPFHWILFNVVIFSLLAADLIYFYLKPHIIKLKEAALISLFWISLAFCFNLWIYLAYGKEPALEFLAGYLLEETLSIDNLFVFLIIFAHFKVPPKSKHIVLFYGILGAIIMRALLIWGGIKLIANFYFVFHIFGVILVLTGLKLLFHKDAEQNLEEKWVYRICSKLFNISKEYQGNNFFTKSNGKLVATPLFIVLILIETTDLIFALDSIPAVIGITKDPFIIYTSNIFAVLGLRSLFFLLEGLAKVFYLLHYAVAVILVFIGTKMILSEIYHLPIKATLIVLISIITISIVGSYLVPQNKNEN